MLLFRIELRCIPKYKIYSNIRDDVTVMIDVTTSVLGDTLSPAMGSLGVEREFQSRNRSSTHLFLK
jgi:hypothetical protein